MIYGMRQFREEGAEFPTDSILMEDDDFFRGPRDSNARADPLRQQLRFQYQYELLPQPQNSAVPRLLTVLLMDAANAVAVASMAVASAARTPPGPGAVAGPPYGMTPLQRQQQQQQLWMKLQPEQRQERQQEQQHRNHQISHLKTLFSWEHLVHLRRRMPIIQCGR